MVRPATALAHIGPGSSRYAHGSFRRKISRIKATMRPVRVFPLLKAPLIMEHTREEGRAQLIKISMILSSVLSILAFTLARVPW